MAATKTTGPATLCGVVPLKDHPAYKPEAEKLERLRVELRETERQINEKQNDLLRGPASDAVRERAADLLKDGAAGPADWQRRNLMRAELEDLRDRLRVVREAIRLQEGKLSGLEHRLARQVLPAFQPALRAVQRRELEAAADLARAIELEQVFLGSVAALGYPTDFVLSSLGAFELGRASDYHGRLCGLIRMAVRDGIIPPTDPVVGQANVLLGNETFLPEVAERIRKEHEEAVRKQEEYLRNGSTEVSRSLLSRLWGGDKGKGEEPGAGARYEAERDARERQQRLREFEPTPQQAAGQRVRESIAGELADVLDLVEPASVA